MTRFAVSLAAVASLTLSGCASGGGGGGGVDGAPEENEYTRSAQLFLTQVQILPDTDTLARAEKYQDVLGAAMNSIADDSANARGYFLAAQAQIGLGDYTAADTLFDHALERYEGYADEVRFERESAWIGLFNEAIGPLDVNDYDEGIRLLEQAEAIYPSQRPEALINLAVTYSQAGRADDAIGAYSAALVVIRNPNRDRVDSATAADWGQRDQSVTVNLATTLSELERYEEALSVYGDYFAFSGLAMADWDRPPDEALVEYQRYLAEEPGDMSTLTNVAAVLSALERPDDAQAIYDAVEDQPTLSMRERFNIGVGYYQAGAFDRAAEAFAVIKEMAPENRDAVFNLAQSLSEGEAWEALVPVARELVELDAHNRDSYTILIQALVETGESQEAGTVLNEREALPFHLADSVLRPRTGGASLLGEFVNNTLTTGSEVTIRVHFNGIDGFELGTVDQRIEAPAPEEGVAFQVDFASDEPVFGYYYEVISTG